MRVHARRGSRDTDPTHNPAIIEHRRSDARRALVLFLTINRESLSMYATDLPLKALETRHRMSCKLAHAVISQGGAYLGVRQVRGDGLAQSGRMQRSGTAGRLDKTQRQWARQDIQIEHLAIAPYGKIDGVL